MDITQTVQQGGYCLFWGVGESGRERRTFEVLSNLKVSKSTSVGYKFFFYTLFFNVFSLLCMNFSANSKKYDYCFFLLVHISVFISLQCWSFIVLLSLCRVKRKRFLNWKNMSLEICVLICFWWQFCPMVSFMFLCNHNYKSFIFPTANMRSLVLSPRLQSCISSFSFVQLALHLSF